MTKTELKRQWTTLLLLRSRPLPGDLDVSPGGEWRKLVASCFVSGSIDWRTACAWVASPPNVPASIAKRREANVARFRPALR